MPTAGPKRDPFHHPQIEAQHCSPRGAGTSNAGPSLHGWSPSHSHLGLRRRLGDVQLPLPHARLSCMRIARPCCRLQCQVAVKTDRNRPQLVACLARKPATNWSHASYLPPVASWPSAPASVSYSYPNAPDRQASFIHSGQSEPLRSSR